ncbi:MAG: S46 family peptidase [Bacteroidetes bacterium]|nr:S46 family peptidase [Bacteroidota bacterium]
MLRKLTGKSAPFLMSTLLALYVLLASHTHEEGMFPLNYLNEKELQQAGMKLGVKEIFNPGEIALTNALVKVGGCTGSFISKDGLIITNHHCVYGGVAGLSTKEHDYLENGFTASTREMELPIDMPCRITQSYEDVSARVLAGTDDATDPAVRAQTIAANIKKTIEEEKKETPDLSVEISEMFVGKSYTLFRYFLITDVRLVYAPPVTIGQFGGDLDNWEWPRHNGDFSLVRAYVGKDGKPAKFSTDNVPFHPAKHLKVNANGTKEGDFVFIMGYPGRTFRHESAPYMKYQQEIQLPTIQGWYAWLIRQMRDRSAEDRNKYLAFAGEIQSLENVEKNYRGKMQGLTRTNLVQRKYADEDAMAAGGNAETKTLVNRIREIWTRKTQLAAKRYVYLFMQNHSNPFYAAQQIEMAEDAMEETKSKSTKETILNSMKKALSAGYSITDVGYEKAILKELIKRLETQGVNLKGLCGKAGTAQWVERKLLQDKLFDTAWVMQTLRKKPAALAAYDGPLNELLEFIESDMQTTETEFSQLDLELKALMPRYLDAKEKFKAGQFIPDANSTLRLTYGYIKRYKPNDAEIHMPYTTLNGIFEKANTQPDYRLPAVVADNLRVENVPAMLRDPETGEVTVAFLYNLDTTGGNSGSPVLDAEGNLIGVNFDRAFTATINDYAWNDKYSRSIGCDIRYVLYVLKYVGKADHLLLEMGVDI